MACTFSVPFSTNPDNLLKQIRQAVKGLRGTMEGDDTSGQLAVSSPIGYVAGSYKIEGQEITLTITRKPLLVTCNMIKSAVRKTIARM